MLSTILVVGGWIQSHLSLTTNLPPSAGTHRVPNGDWVTRPGYSFTSTSGMLILEMTTITPTRYYSLGTALMRPTWNWTTLGFGFHRTPDGHPLRYTALAIPYWFLTIFTALIPTLWLYKRIKHIPHGHCSKCGYDLRVSKDWCPECGAAIEASIEQSAAP